MHQVCKSSRGVWVIEKDDDLACDVVKVFAGTSGEGNTSVPLQKGFLISRSSCMEYLRRSRFCLSNISQFD